MPYIYRYLDKNDGIYKYVGISRSRKTLKKRIRQHMSDYWYKNGEWTVECAYVESECDAQFLEGWLISALETSSWYNVQKADWGTSSLFTMPMLAWVEFQFSIKDCISEEVDEISAENEKLKQKVANLNGKLQRTIASRNKIVDECRRLEKENRNLRVCAKR